MFSHRKGLLIITILALLSVPVAVRVGQAQKPGSTKTSPAGHAVLASNVAVMSHAVGFAETRPVRELMDSVTKSDRELQQEAEEINELNTDFVRRPNPNAPAQSDGALQ